MVRVLDGHVVSRTAEILLAVKPSREDGIHGSITSPS